MGVVTLPPVLGTFDIAAVNAAISGQIIQPSSITLQSTGYVGWSSRFVFRAPSSGEVSFRDFAETIQANLAVEANDILSQRRGTNAQTSRTYNTFTDASNYERLSAGWSGNVFQFMTDALGTGTHRGMQFRADGTTFMELGVGGTDGLKVYRNGTTLATLLNVTSNGLSSTAVNFARLTPTINQASGTYNILDINPTETAIGAGPHYLIRGRIGAGSDVFNVSNAGNVLSGPLLRIGGTASSNVLLKNSSSQLLLRDATDSNYLGLTLKLLQAQAHTVASLPAAASWNGGIAFVDNLTSTTRGSTATGSGALKGIVWSDGTNWIVM